VLYRIKNWDKHYENNRTRDLKEMHWVPIPISFDSDGYTLIMEKKNGPAIYGAWVALVLLAGRCEMRGTLMRKGKICHDAVSISRMTRCQISVIKEMLEVCHHECGWIEVDHYGPETAIPQEGATIPQVDAAIPHPTDYGMEWNGMEGNTIAPSLPPTQDAFEIFWKAYPKKKSKGDAKKAWKQMKPNLDEVLSALAWQVAQSDWIKQGGQFIPYPASYLRASGWEDEPDVIKKRVGGYDPMG